MRAEKAVLPHAEGAPWSVRNAATFLGVSEVQIRTHIKHGRIKKINIGGRVLVPDHELRRVAAEGC